MVSEAKQHPNHNVGCWTGYLLYRQRGDSQVYVRADQARVDNLNASILWCLQCRPRSVAGYNRWVESKGVYFRNSQWITETSKVEIIPHLISKKEHFSKQWEVHWTRSSVFVINLKWQIIRGSLTTFFWFLTLRRVGLPKRRNRIATDYGIRGNTVYTLKTFR